MIAQISTIPSVHNFTVNKNIIDVNTAIFEFLTLPHLNDVLVSINVFDNIGNLVGDFNSNEDQNKVNKYLNTVIWSITPNDYENVSDGFYTYTIKIQNVLVVSGGIYFDIGISTNDIRSIVRDIISTDYALSESDDKTKITIYSEMDVTGNTTFSSDVTFDGFLVLPQYATEQDATNAAKDSLKEAMMYYDTTDKVIKTYDGNSWQ